jgi:methyltransferase (TIGR00027 family)
MKDRPSFTAEWVAAARALGSQLPADVRLAEDPYGARFLGGPVSVIAHAGLVPPMLPFVLYMQLRTRAIDDVLRAFAKERSADGAQVVLLGAGYDCRAARFARELTGAGAHGTVFEVDHPATQAKKRAALGDVVSAPVQYVEWDFERRALAELSAALAQLGHDRARPTLTIWEGVTMYLSEPAIDEAVRAVGAYSSPGSPLCFTYFDRAIAEKPTLPQKLMAAFVRGVGEPFTFGWKPDELGGWLAPRGFTLEQDKDARVLAAELLPPGWAARVDFPGRHVALARKTR